MSAANGEQLTRPVPGNVELSFALQIWESASRSEDVQGTAVGLGVLTLASSRTGLPPVPANLLMKAIGMTSITSSYTYWIWMNMG